MVNFVVPNVDMDSSKNQSRMIMNNCVFRPYSNAIFADIKQRKNHIWKIICGLTLGKSRSCAQFASSLLTRKVIFEAIQKLTKSSCRMLVRNVVDDLLLQTISRHTKSVANEVCMHANDVIIKLFTSIS